MMDLNELLADIDGIGGDTFIPSVAQGTPPRDADDIAAARAVDAPVDEMPAALTMDQVLGEIPTPSAPAFGALDMVLDVELQVEVELGLARLPLKDVLTLGAGAALTLDRRQDDPVKIFVNDRLVAYGDALVVDGALAVKVVEFLAPEVASQEMLSCDR